MSNKETKAKVANAFKAMKGLGISEDKVKPVLKNLLKLYDKNWALIEEENYRALADAIFDKDETEAVEQSKKTVNTEAAEHSREVTNSEKKKTLVEEAQAAEEPERPLKRLRRKYQDGQSSSASAANNSNSRIPLVIPKEEPGELPETRSQKLKASRAIGESSQATAQKARVDSQVDTCQSPGKSKGKQPISPTSLIVHEASDPSQPSGTSRSQQNTQLATSHPMRLRERGKGTVSPQTTSRRKRPVSESSSLAVCLKEPKLEPGVVQAPQQKSNGSQTLITPKDEPTTDDIPPLEVHTAIVCADPSDGRDSQSGNGTTRVDDHFEPSVLPPVNDNETDDHVSTPNELQNNGEQEPISGQCSSNWDIASSPSGDVKISFSCNLARRRPDFHMPSLESVIKLVEEKYLKSYKTLDQNFSVMSLMEEMCQCFLKLGSGSDRESPSTTNVTHTLNGSVDCQFNTEPTLPEAPLLGNDLDDDSHPEEVDGGEQVTNIENKDNCGEDMNNPSLVAAQQPQETHEVMEAPQETHEVMEAPQDVVDIAKGQEKVIITLVNEVNNESPPTFHYIPQNVVFQNAYLNFSLARIGDNNCCSACSENCLSLSTPCACSHETGGEFAYTADGLVQEDFLKECISMNRDPKKHCQFFCKECPLERSKCEDIIEPCKGHLVRRFIKECWSKCGCNKQCGNRVVQRGITRKLQVFMAPGGKGWGVRTLEDLPRGAFVCEYVGEVLTNAELFDRVLRSPKGERHSYPVLLDADWGAEGMLKDEDALCLDATHYGNVGRFINHRCYDSNLVEIPVEVESPDHHYYHLAFFTTRKVKAMEELTWDYGIDFDDHEHPIKAFRCQCGSRHCRNIKRSRRSSRR